VKIERSLKVAGAAVSLFYLLIATWWLLGIVSPGLAPRIRGQARYRLAKVRRRVRYTWVSEAAQVRGEPIEVLYDSVRSPIWRGDPDRT